MGKLVRLPISNLASSCCYALYVLIGSDTPMTNNVALF